MVKPSTVIGILEKSTLDHELEITPIHLRPWSVNHCVIASGQVTLCIAICSLHYCTISRLSK